MTQEEKQEIIRQAVSHYSKTSRMWLACEEMAELTDALAKYQRARVNKKDIITEIADVQIMMAELSLIFGVEEVSAELERKLARLKETIKKDNNE